MYHSLPVQRIIFLFPESTKFLYTSLAVVVKSTKRKINKKNKNLDIIFHMTITNITKEYYIQFITSKRNTNAIGDPVRIK